MSESFRTEQDSMGAIQVPTHALWGAQTQRSIINFSIGKEDIPMQLIYALARIKQAAAIANNRLQILDKKRSDCIVKAANEIAMGLHDDHFPLKVWQTGSGTQTNMNVNEVISNLASQEHNEELGSHSPVHPNDHVNQSQSTNDTFPSAIHIAVVTHITQTLLPELEQLIKSLGEKRQNWKDIVKIGRTHLQDAVPLTLGDEVSAWEDQIATAYSRIKNSLDELYLLPLGGTAVGTGLNAPQNFDKEIVAEINRLTQFPFRPAPNKFAIMASHDGLVNTMSQLKLLAVSLLKIVNDIRLLACGPRAGLAELQLPENEPGSSIMPGKVNPTQCEAMAMVCTQVIGLDTAVALAGSGGHLQMNSYKPLIGFNLLYSIDLLRDACKSCRQAMIEGITPNRLKIKNDLERSLMLITALAPRIGYKKASDIAKMAHKNNISLREAAITLEYVTTEDFDMIINPVSMANPYK